MRLLVWGLRGLLFVLVLVFALRNQHEVALQGLFGEPVRAPLILMLMAAFLGGAVLGLSSLLPTWWRLRRPAVERSSPEAAVVLQPSPRLDDRVPPDVPLTEAPPRDGL